MNGGRISRVTVYKSLLAVLIWISAPLFQYPDGICWTKRYELKKFSEIEWIDAKPGMKLHCDFIIKTGNDGIATIGFPSDVTLTLFEGRKMFYPSKMIVPPNDYFLNDGSLYVDEKAGCEITVISVEGDVKVSKNSDVYLRSW
jgi:hypothetical protein